MRVLVLWADERSANLGVRALAKGSEALLRRVWPDAVVEFQNFGRGPAPLPIQTARSLIRARVTGRAGLQRWLGSYDVVVDTRSGDSFADIYGPRRLETMSTLAECAREAGAAVVLGPQTIGPFRTPRGRMIGRFSLHRAALVMARDSESARCAAGLGRAVDALTTDVAFALPATSVPKSRDVVLNISGLLWGGGPHVDGAEYRRTIAALHRGIVGAGRSVALLAHVLESASPDNDVPAIREFAAEHAPQAEVIVPASLADVRDVVASAEVVVGSRMHACLNALSVGTPAIPLAYSRKFAPLFGDLGWPHTVDLRSNSDPARDVLRLLDLPALDSHARAVRDRAHQSLGAAESALRGL